MPSSLFFITAVGVCGAVVGVVLESAHGWSRRMVPFGGGVLIGVALVWIIPEIAELIGWPGAVAWSVAGLAVLAAVDRWVAPVCPACSPGHEHGQCATRLHGFAVPLLIAASLHSALDGWSAVAASDAPAFTRAFAIAITFHKLPEGIALGVIARASMKSKSTALLWCAIAEGMTLAGGAMQAGLAPHLNPYSLYALLAGAAGCFVYLGGHAIHSELRRSGATPAIVPALTGVAGSSVLRLFL